MTISHQIPVCPSAIRKQNRQGQMWPRLLLYAAMDGCLSATVRATPPFPPNPNDTVTYREGKVWVSVKSR